jgi:hypothetical protein
MQPLYRLTLTQAIAQVLDADISGQSWTVMDLPV